MEYGPDRLLTFPAFALAILLCAAGLAAAPQPLSFYVSPEGSDLFTGTTARNNPRRTDGPFATVEHARDTIRALKRSRGAPPDRPINVYLRGGTYWLLQPFILTPEDSGTARGPISYLAYPGETPILSAGRPVRGWRKVTFNGREVWAAKLPQLMNADEGFHEMWVNGNRRPLARWPHQGFFRVAQVPDLAKDTRQDAGQTRFVFDGQDLKSLPDIAEADVVVMSLWAESHLPVKSLEEQQHTIEFTRPTMYKMTPGDCYFIEGAAEMLDEPGEWWFDRKAGTIYYIPQKDDGMIGSQFVIPWHEQIVRLEGRPRRGEFVEHVNFAGITFANSGYDYPLRPTPGREALAARSGFGQAAVGVPGAVWGVGVRECAFDDCTVAHAGNYGIELAEGCQGNTISHCVLFDLGAGGIKLGEQRIRAADAQQTRGNEISDCTVANCGNTYPSAVGIWLGQTGENRISHNDIHGLWYTGISVGWTWGYGDSIARGNTFELNHVHHIGTPADGVDPILSDMGAIYTLGIETGTVIRNNLFHDIAGLRYGGWGIYFDEGSSNILAENNIVYRTTHGGLHQHYGANNTVRNNIFAFGRDAQIQRSRVEDHLSFTFEQNIVYWDRGSLLAGNWSKLNVAFDHNTYWHVGGERFAFGGRSWDQWHAEDMDRHSQIADPLFVNPEHDDFHLRPGSTQRLGGFVPFTPLPVGPRSRAMENAAP